jgi:hypothetical protein
MSLLRAVTEAFRAFAHQRGSQLVRACQNFWLTTKSLQVFLNPMKASAAPTATRASPRQADHHCHDMQAARQVVNG